MDVNNKVVAVTGGASGIGKAMCRRFAQGGAKGVVVADVNEAGAALVSKEIERSLPFRCDVRKEADITGLVHFIKEKYGPVDLFCSNAGILAVGWIRSLKRGVAAHLGDQRACPYFCGEGCHPRNDCPGRRQHHDHRIRRRTAQPDRVSSLLGYQARGRRSGGKLVYHIRRPGNQSLRTLSSGGLHGNDGRYGRRRRCRGWHDGTRSIGRCSIGGFGKRNVPNPASSGSQTVHAAENE